MDENFDPIGDLNRALQFDDIEAKARRRAESYGLFGLTRSLLPKPPEGLCWYEFTNPPASEVANGYCYGKKRYIYGCNGAHGGWGYGFSPYELGRWPITMPRGAEYFVVLLYKDAAT
jgi:hypothetical protein